LRTNAMELQRGQQAQHRFWHALANLLCGLVLCDLGTGQAVKATGNPLQLACLVQTQQKLRRPTALAHIRSPKHTLVPGQFKDVVGLIHGLKFNIRITCLQVMQFRNLR